MSADNPGSRLSLLGYHLIVKVGTQLEL